MQLDLRDETRRLDELKEIHKLLTEAIRNQEGIVSYLQIKQRREVSPTIEAAGVDPKHQTVSCDHCGHVFKNDDVRFGVLAASHTLILCKDCYKKAGNSVR